MYEIFLDWLPVVILILLGFNTKSVDKIESDKEQYVALSKIVFGFTAIFLTLMVIDSIKNLFFG